MMLKGTAALVPPCIRRPACCASNPKTNIDQLRFQLDQLHTEAETTRAKASSARLRLMRLSEAAERLKKQAAVSVYSGKENEARELLCQKKKVMQAMERSKSRIELLDELSAKLNKAISVKESQLIGTTALDLEVDREDASGPVRIVSPREGFIDDTNEHENIVSGSLELRDSQDVKLHAEDETKAEIDKAIQSLSTGNIFEDGIIRGLKDISSYDDFLAHLDLQLNRIEAELVTILNVSSLVLNGEERPENSKVQQTIELLESIRGVRQRIARIMQKVDVR